MSLAETHARGTAVDDRMPAPRACSALQRSSSPIGRLLHCGASEQSVACRCCARAVVERPISSATASLSLSLSLAPSLSLSPGWRRLLLSAAWQSEARHFLATAYSRCSCCWLTFLAELSREKRVGKVRAGARVGGTTVCAYECVHTCARSRASLSPFQPPRYSHVIF